MKFFDVFIGNGIEWNCRKLSNQNKSIFYYFIVVTKEYWDKLSPSGEYKVTIRFNSIAL